jgi:D-alanine-D-alanine ligase
MLAEPGARALVPHPLAEPGPTAQLPSFDVVFPVLHGTYGEDGTMQGLLDLAGVAYVGSGVLGSSVGMDKVFQKAYWRGLGFPIVDYVPLRRTEIEQTPQAIIERVEANLRYPMFTKPANLGSSVGVHKVRTRAELEAGLRDSARYDSQVLVEQGLDVRELECAVLGNDEPVASVVGEIVPHADFYSYRAKYLDEGSEALIPAPIPAALSDAVRDLAVRAFSSIHAAGLARVDCFLERGTDRLYLNEVNTMPGFTRISMYPKLWEASGIRFPELVDRLVQLALERAAERGRNETSYDTASD